MPPDSACTVNSVAGLSCHGPSSPNGVMAVTIRWGWRPQELGRRELGVLGHLRPA